MKGDEQYFQVVLFNIMLYKVALPFESVDGWSPQLAIAGFHCHAIKIKIENHSMNEVKKFTCYRR